MNKLVVPETPIRIDNPAYDFFEHLTLNDRILFSGAFGIGKTFFLREFFKINEIKEKYNVFHLYPVNYQIANNEDIFELIKYDILYHLFSFEWINVKVEEFSKVLAVQSYLLNNGASFFSKIMKCIPLYGIDVAGSAIETFINFRKDFYKHYEEIKSNDEKLLAIFREQIEEKKGSIYEFDTISEFIYNNLANCNNGIAEKEKHKKNVLIIDDLDRIDPEHIFRLLNIFSAHTDKGDGINKFGFDTIIFVCDVANIRSIFAAKYGQQTDFSGYIDKFYSSEIFHFNNKIAITEFVKQLMNSNYKTKANNYYTNDEIVHIGDILYSFVEGRAINLRNIIANVKDFKIKKEQMGFIGRYYYYSAYTIIWVCSKILGNQKEVLINAFRKAKLPSNILFDLTQTGIINLVLPLLIDDFTNPPINSESTVRQNNIDFKFTLRTDTTNRFPMIYANFTSAISVDFETLKIMLIEATNKLYDKGLLD